MKVDDISLEKIRPYENNPRLNDDAVDAVAASMDEFGVLVPIVLDSDYTIVAGHTRYKAAQKRGVDSYPCLIADNLTDEQVKAYRLADNKTAEIAKWNDAALVQEIAEIENIDMEQFGFIACGKSDIDFDSFFDEAAPKEQQPKTVTCPHCGKEFEL